MVSELNFPAVTSPLEAILKLLELSVRAFAPRVQVEGAAPVKFKAPAEVTARVPEVTVERVRLLEVVERVEAPRPDILRTPELPVIFIAPVALPRVTPLVALVPILVAPAPAVLILVAPVTDKPALPVRSPAEVIVPVPAVARVTFEPRDTAVPLSVIEELPIVEPVAVNLAKRFWVPDPSTIAVPPEVIVPEQAKFPLLLVIV